MASHADSFVPEAAAVTDVRKGRMPAPAAALGWAVLALSLGGALTVAALWVPLVLAIWTAILARPLHERLGRWLHGRERAAGALIAALVVLVLTPLTLLLVSLVSASVELFESLHSSPDRVASLRNLLSGTSSGVSFDPSNTTQLADLLQRHGATAWRAATVIGGTAAFVVISGFVYAFGVWVLLVDGRRAWAWARARSPLGQSDMERLGGAFVETGRGLIIGIGLTALAQGLASTLAYFVVGVPEAALLGALTFLAAFAPGIGTGLVWVPLAAGLALAGRTGAAIAIVCVGVVVSTTDNWLRPVLLRYGHLQLPTFVLLVSMVGGLAMFGPGGLLLGPLLVRMGVEGLDLLHERGEHVDATTQGDKAQPARGRQGSQEELRFASPAAPRPPIG